MLKSFLRIRFHPRLGIRYADFGPLGARFVVAMSSGADFFNSLSHSAHLGE